MEARIRSLANRAAKSGGSPFRNSNGLKAGDNAALASATSVQNSSGPQPTDVEKEALIQTLIDNVKGKKDFEGVFANADGPATFGRQHNLTANQLILLEAMRYQKDVYRPNALLDAIMTIGFAVTCTVMAKILWAQDLLTAFCLGLLLTHAVVHRIREIGAATAMWLGNLAVRSGLVDVNPFLTPLQMKKWQDQFWQLAIHVVTSALEWHILSTEPWWNDPKTCWMPSCEEQKKGPVRLDLKLLYISQLVSVALGVRKRAELRHDSDQGSSGQEVMPFGYYCSLPFKSSLYFFLVFPAGHLDVHLHRASFLRRAKEGLLHPLRPPSSHDSPRVGLLVRRQHAYRSLSVVCPRHK
jgi:hypothetical protein